MIYIIAINRNKESFVLPSINTLRSSFQKLFLRRQDLKMVFEIKAVVSARINTLIKQLLAYYEDGTIEGHFNRYVLDNGKTQFRLGCCNVIIVC